MLAKMKEGAYRKGFMTTLFDKPDEKATKYQSKKCQDLNRTLSSSPERIHPLPPGFYLDKKIWQTRSYEVPVPMRSVLPEATIISVELLDSVIAGCLGIHVLADQVQFHEATVVKESRALGQLFTTPKKDPLRLKVPNQEPPVDVPSLAIYK